jgi:thioredoxin-related protein
MAINNPVPPKKSTLDTAANVAIIIVCAIAAVVLIRNQFFPKQAAAPGNMPQIEKGEKYAQLQQVVPAGANRALVVAVQPGCHFCNDSMSFYKRLIDERNQKGSPVRFVAAVPSDDAKAPESQKFAAAGAQPDNIAKVDFSAIKVPGTPTMVLVDNSGKVLHVWVGKLDEGGEKEVLKTL